VEPCVIDRQAMATLLVSLREHGYTPVGPTVRDGAIVYDELESDADFPIGWTDVQEAGSYRLERRDDEALFGYVVGAHSWKKFLFPPATRLFRTTLTSNGLEIDSDTEPAPRYAFIGVRACELAAIAVQDRVFMEGAHVDPTYRTRREGALLIAVNCGQAGNTCFCVSMETGPKTQTGFDLALTELLDAGRHEFVVEVGTDRGREILEAVPHRPATDEDLEAAGRAVERASGQMGRHLDTTDIKKLLYENHDHPRWDEVASRCLTCANCTMACPTCFCSTVEDVTDLTGRHAERWRKWDSCFTLDFSYIHGGSVRVSARSRYRQWMTHKLASWIDQFGSSGCVGCGRCITWCPVGIDITEEVAAIRAHAPVPSEPVSGEG
jgi:formate hydrogenlyase subunit 6/NADH:ubiquinone oxidoreductase subunit I